MPTSDETATTDPAVETTGVTPLVYDAWITEQPDEVKTMLAAQVTGLKSALDAERKSSKKFEKDLRDAAKLLEDGNQTKAQLTSLADQLAETQREKKFYAAAHDAKTNNLELAFMAAQKDGLVDSDGDCNFDQLKSQYPQLFAPEAKPIPKGNAGTGTGATPPLATGGMNAYIRASTGRPAQ